MAVLAALPLGILRVRLIAAGPDLGDAARVGDGVSGGVLAGGVLSSPALCRCSWGAVAWL